ncbi:MAG: 2-oxoacid:ferredoxin oxidoreductase subunit beta [Candidatus Thermoplasmatota archaeon]|nr:2-oxoacid:ferredoxin oxidoreductase subunit beta [Candidatus Thermoplasmatota archaeon]MBS3790184.1 2-oxoacid:ferredoxin oxidoreductase subunit beta [Candidatus Thermoplasmatota archaeon]
MSIRKSRDWFSPDYQEQERDQGVGHGLHPLDKYLRKDRIPHIWCPGCGLGVILNAYLRALKDSDIPPEDTAVVSGIGCSGRAAGYVDVDSFHVTHGRAIPFATGLKVGNRDLKTTVFSGDGDLFAIGGNHFIHAARRNVDFNVICVNNFNYGMTGGQAGPTTPTDAETSTTPWGGFEQPFNLPAVAAGAGAVYVARWTTYHVEQLTDSLKEALEKDGFSFIEVMSPCPTGYGRKVGLKTGKKTMKHFKENSEIDPDADPTEVALDPEDPDSKIIVGKFVDRDAPTYQDERGEVFEKAREEMGVE